MWCRRQSLLPCARASDGAVLYLAAASPTLSATWSLSLQANTAQAPLSCRRPLCLDVDEALRERVRAGCTTAQCHAAAALHPRHEVPWLLSRHAATAALRVVCGSDDVCLAGTRATALRAYGAHVSLAHEDVLAAAVAWPASSSSTSAPATHAAHHGDNNGRAAAVAADASVRFAVDVVDVSHMAALCRRRRCFAARMLPQCVTSANDDGDGGGEGEVRAALRLAQHWSLRECCVKLLGVPSRAFAYDCVGSNCARDDKDSDSSPCAGMHDDDDDEDDAADYHTGVWCEGVVHLCRVRGDEASAFAQHGLSTRVRAMTLTVPLVMHDVVYPHVVTVARARHVAAHTPTR